MPVIVACRLPRGFLWYPIAAFLLVGGSQPLYSWMVAYLNRHGMAIFGFYRIALAIVVAALILAGVFQG